VAHDHAGEPAQPSFEDDVRIARAALAEGDLGHASHHVAGAIAAGADRAECAALLDEFCDAAGAGVLDLVPDKDLWYGLGGLRAALLVRAGRRGEAIPLLLACLAAVPAAPFAPWLRTWVLTPNAAAEVDPDTVARELVRCTRHEPLGAALHEIARVLHRAHPSHDLLTFSAVKLARMCWRMDDAVELARAALARAPLPMTAIGLAGTYREMGDIPQALSMFQRAAEMDPRNAGIVLDIGDLSLQLEQLEDSLAAYERALSLEPQNDWAAPSAMYVRWRLTGDDVHADELAAYAQEHPDNRRAADLVHAIDGGD
jgi:tetratricopeptide (TPR) repeat protein